MKKVLSLVLIAILLCGGLFILTGCNDNKGGDESASSEYSKEVETQTVSTTDGTGTITLEFEKNDKYNVTTSGNEITIKNSENYAEVKVRAIHDYLRSTSVTMKESDFSSVYHDFKEVKVGEFSGWEVYRGETNYKTVLVLSEKDDQEKVYAVQVEAIKSPIMKDNMLQFDTAEFVKGEDFQHLLKSIKLTVNQ